MLLQRDGPCIRSFVLFIDSFKLFYYTLYCDLIIHDLRTNPIFLRTFVSRLLYQEKI